MSEKNEKIARKILKEVMLRDPDTHPAIVERIILELNAKDAKIAELGKEKALIHKENQELSEAVKQTKFWQDEYAKENKKSVEQDARIRELVGALKELIDAVPGGHIDGQCPLCIKTNLAELALEPHTPSLKIWEAQEKVVEAAKWCIGGSEEHKRIKGLACTCRLCSALESLEAAKREAGQ